MDFNLTKEQEMIRKEACIRAAFSIRKPLFEQADALAYEMEIPRSRLFAMVVEDFVRRHQNRKLLEAINAAHSELPDKEERALQKKIRDKQHDLMNKISISLER